MAAQISENCLLHRPGGGAEETHFHMPAEIRQNRYWRKSPEGRIGPAATENRREFIVRGMESDKDVECPSERSDSKKSGFRDLKRPGAENSKRKSLRSIRIFPSEFQECKKQQKCYGIIANILDSRELGAIRFICGIFFALFLSALRLANAPARQN